MHICRACKSAKCQLAIDRALLSCISNLNTNTREGGHNKVITLINGWHLRCIDDDEVAKASTWVQSFFSISLCSSWASCML